MSQVTGYRNPSPIQATTERTHYPQEECKQWKHANVIPEKAER
ncbi:MAG TPA: hypothetical protein VJN92_22980 [Candidatus Acidoferrum sp.]|nr:hypothetical protein [Candidatus Acidoferrum sp.]